ncbi:PaaI family thioesterase [Desulfovibrio ferrophilus]|uniref:Phenylacetic acid degradation-like protein n=1 Tax=Desulfovibrio ferrophilus TaxID=241368 RepID=A0A2Z6B2J4_9BACT|nr:PaaI family thioesterase [Desulfovibrio ferrophilus]BBD09744.1 phenylacetic acid degradation-like protein [Desulfovibrio ferrophilus]
MTDIHEDLIAFVEDSIPMHRWLGVKVVEARPGFARVRLPFKDEFRGNEERGAMHGGVVSVLVDVCGAVALWTHFGPKDKTATVDMRVDYQRPAPFEELLAEGEVRMMGNRIANVHVRVFTASMPETQLAEGRCVYYVKRVDQG